MEYYASVASNSKEKMRGIKDKTFGIHLKLNGIFIHDDIMLLRSIFSMKPISIMILTSYVFISRDQKKSKNCYAGN